MDQWTDAEAEAPLLWPPDVKSQLIGKDPDAGKYQRRKEKGSLGWEDPLEKEMATHSRILPGEFHDALNISQHQGLLQ